jgi:hypothetical protein
MTNAKNKEHLIVLLSKIKLILIIFKLFIWLILNCNLLIQSVCVWRKAFMSNYFCGARTWRFITAFTTARHLSLSWARSIHSTPPQPICLRSSPIPSTHRSSEWSPSSSLSHQNLLYISFLSHACHMLRPPHSQWFAWLYVVMSADNEALHYATSSITSSLLGPNILFSTLFSNSLSLCSSFNVRDQVSHPYKTTGRIMGLYVLTFTFLDNRREDKRLKWKVASVARI